LGGAGQRQVRTVDCLSVLDGQTCSDDVLDAFAAAANQRSPCVNSMSAADALAQPCTILDQLTLCVNSARPDSACSQSLLDAYRRAVAWLGDLKGSEGPALTAQLLPGMTTNPAVRVPDATSFGVAAGGMPGAEFAPSTALAPNLGPLASNAHDNDKGAKGGTFTELIAGAAQNQNRNGTIDNDQPSASRLGTQDLAVYLSISAATLAVLCAMGALMTWKALESKRRRLAGLDDDDDDLMVDEEAVDTFLAAGQTDPECASGDLLGDQQMAVFSSSVPDDDDPLRWNSMSELSPISSDLHSPWDPTSPSSSSAQSDVAILFGPGAVMTPVSDSDHPSPPPLLLPSDTASDATAASTTTTSTTAAATSKKKRARVDNSKPAPVSSTSSSSSGAAQVQPQSKVIVVTSDGASSRRARPPATAVAPPATKSAVAAFMSAGARSTKLSYGTKLPSAPTATATASASTSAKTSAKSSPVESTPSPAPLSGSGEEDGAFAFSNIKLPSV
jgi:hypothetical protein